MLLLSILAAFVSTNMDTFSILVALFAQADLEVSQASAIHISVGFLLAFSIICAASLTLSWLGTQFFPSGYVELIGIFPFLLGVWNLLILFVPDHGIGEDGGPELVLQRGGYTDIPDTDSDYDVHDWFLHSEVVKVTSWIIASGGDNVVMYSALFAAHRYLSAKLTILVVSYLLALCLLAITHKLVHLPAVHDWVKRHGRYVIPWLWIAIGLNILQDSILATEIDAFFS